MPLGSTLEFDTYGFTFGCPSADGQAVFAPMHPQWELEFTVCHEFAVCHRAQFVVRSVFPSLAGALSSLAPLAPVFWGRGVGGEGVVDDCRPRGLA